MAGLNWGESECSTKLLHTVQYYGLHLAHKRLQLLGNLFAEIADRLIHQRAQRSCRCRTTDPED